MSKVSEHIKSGRMWLNEDGKWCKRCPACSREVVGKDGFVTTKFNVSHSVVVGKVCHSCVKIGKPTWASTHPQEFGKRISGSNHPFYGKQHSDSFKARQRIRYLGTSLSEITKEKLRWSARKAWENPVSKKKYADALCRTKWIRVRTDKGQLEMLDKWNQLGFQFEPNYQLRIGDELFYLDGYDPARNVVLEYDSGYHSRGGQRTRDQVRERKIINHLHPRRFWRYISKKSLFIECMTRDFVDNRG